MHLDVGTYDVIILDAIGFAPSIHDPSIIVCNDSNDVDTLFLDLREVLDVWREMVGGTSGREGACDLSRRFEMRPAGPKWVSREPKENMVRRTRNTEENDLLVGPFLGCIVVLRPAAGGDLVSLLGVGDISWLSGESA